MNRMMFVGCFALLAALAFGNEATNAPFGGTLDGLALCTEQKSGSIVLVDASKAGAPAFAWEWNPNRDPGIRKEHVKWFLAPSDCRMLPGRVLLMAASGGAFARIPLATGRADAYGFIGGNPHAAEPLPGGQFFVTASSNGYLTLFDISEHPMEPEKQFKRTYPLESAHGVVWDERRGCLWAIGFTNIVRYAWHPRSRELSETARFDFTAVVGDNGHDLQSDDRGGFFFTSNNKVAHFDPDTGAICVVKDRKAVKSFSRNERYGDLSAVVREVWWTDRLLVDKDGAEHVVGPYPGARFYKARWATTRAPRRPADESRFAYSVAILGDLHYDAEPESVYHSNYDESNRWAKIQHAEFRRNGEMWRGRCRDLVAASGCLARERPTDFVLQLGDLIQGDCDDVPTHQRMLDDCIAMLRAHYQDGLPFLTVVGNHDVRGKGARRAYFDFAERFLSRELGKDVAYPAVSMMWGGDLWVFCDFGNRDLTPFIAAIEARPDARHTFVVTHGPFTPSESAAAWWRLAGEKESDALRPKLYELLSRRHAIVLSGHMHTTAWFRHENEFGGFTEFTANSVWMRPNLATAEPVCEGAAEYGKRAAALKLTGRDKAVFDAASKEFRPGLRGYFLSMGAGHSRLNVSETGVTIDYYPGAANVPARTFKMK